MPSAASLKCPAIDIYRVRDSCSPPLVLHLHSLEALEEFISVPFGCTLVLSFFAAYTFFGLDGLSIRYFEPGATFFTYYHITL